MNVGEVGRGLDFFKNIIITQKLPGNKKEEQLYYGKLIDIVITEAIINRCDNSTFKFKTDNNALMIAQAAVGIITTSNKDIEHYVGSFFYFAKKKALARIIQNFQVPHSIETYARELLSKIFKDGSIRTTGELLSILIFIGDKLETLHNYGRDVQKLYHSIQQLELELKRDNKTGRTVTMEDFSNVLSRYATTTNVYGLISLSFALGFVSVPGGLLALGALKAAAQLGKILTFVLPNTENIQFVNYTVEMVEYIMFIIDEILKKVIYVAIQTKDFTKEELEHTIVDRGVAKKTKLFKKGIMDGTITWTDIPFLYPELAPGDQIPEQLGIIIKDVEKFRSDVKSDAYNNIKFEIVENLLSDKIPDKYLLATLIKEQDQGTFEELHELIVTKQKLNESILEITTELQQDDMMYLETDVIDAARAELHQQKTREEEELRMNQLSIEKNRAFVEYKTKKTSEESHLQTAVNYVQNFFKSDFFKSDYFGFGQKKTTEQGEIDDDAEQIVGDPFGFLSGPPTPGLTMDPATALPTTTTALPTTTADSRRRTSVGGMKIHNRRRRTKRRRRQRNKF